MNINKMLGIFGLQLKSKKEPIKKVSRNGLSSKHHKEYQLYHHYFISKTSDWKNVYEIRKKACDRAVNSYVKLHNSLWNAVELFGTEDEKKEVANKLGEEIIGR